MKSIYKKLGPYIREINVRNLEDKKENLLGVSVSKVFIDSIANTIGTDFTKYKVVKRNQFTYIPDTSRRGDKIAIALLEDRNEALVSQAYTVFEISDTESLLPEYLMMWFRRIEFDRYARFISHGSVREIFSWGDMCDVQLPIPSISEQKKIVNEYNVFVDRISLRLRQINKLEEAAQTIYRQWFLDFDFPDENGKPYKSNGGEMVYNEELDIDIPKGWRVGNLGECIEFSNGYGFESSDLLDTEEEDCYSVFKMGNIKKGGGLNINGTKSWIEKEKCVSLSRFILKKGDLLMAMTDMKENIGLLGNTAIINVDNKFILNQRVGLIRAKNDFGISFRHLYTITNSVNFLRDLRSRANIGVQVNLTTAEIVSSKILIAQEHINLKFDNNLKSIFNKMSIIEKDLELSESAQKLLLSKLATLGG